MAGVRSSWWVVSCGVLAVACGQTRKNDGAQPNEPGGVAGSAGAGGAPGAIQPGPHCAVALASDGARYCAVYEDGSLWCWGSDPKPKRIEVPGRVNALFMGAGNTCAVVPGKLYCWGDNARAQLRDEPGAVSEPIDLVLGTGSPIHGLAIDGEHLCAVDVLQHVYCRGGELSSPTQVDVGSGLALLSMPGPGTEVFDDEGRLYSLIEPSKPKLITDLGPGNAAIGTFSAPTCLLRRGGSLWCSDYLLDESSPLRVKVELGETVASVAVGDLFACALENSGRVWCEGYDQLGQTGRGTKAVFSAGDFVPELGDAVRIASARASVCALRKDGSVWCWGTYSPDVTDIAPHEVTGCENQQATLEAPTLAPQRSLRLADASRARAQAMCQCSFGGLPDPPSSCETEENVVAGAACIEALAPDHAAAACLAERFWREAQCYGRSTECGGGTVTDCADPDPCAADELWRNVLSYCSRPDCTDGGIITRHQLCDGKPDCADGSDELNCVATSPPSFDCDGKQSVPVVQMCDGKFDCDNIADERRCL